MGSGFIGNVRSTLGDLSIKWKLTAAYTVAILIPTLVIGYYSFQLSEKTVVRQNIEASSNLLYQMKDSIQRRVDMAEEIGDNLAQNLNIQRFLRSEMNFTADAVLDYRINIYSVLSNAVKLNTLSAYKISLYVANPSISESWPYFYRESQLDSQQWYAAFKESSRKGLWIYPTQVDAFRPLSHQANRYPAFTYARKITDINGRYLGVAMVDILLEDLMTPLKRVKPEEGVFAAVDSNRQVVFCTDKAFSARMEKAFPELSGVAGEIFAEKSYLRNNTLYVSDSVAGLDLNIAGIIPLGEKINNYGRSGRMIIIGIILGVLLLELFTFLIIKRVFKRLRRMVSIMDKAAANQFDIMVPVDYNDEVGKLARDFNRLLQNNKVLMGENIRREVLQKDAQIQALQYQINPHFIYNTLDLFRMKMEAHGLDDTAEALVDFGDIMRYNIGSRSKIATLGEEIQNVVHYIHLQKFKYGDRLTFEVRVPEELLSKEMIKFVLQPVVENSIKHGFEEKDDGMRLEISANREDRDILIKIRDNGKGIGVEALERLNGLLEGTLESGAATAATGGIGLENINERLRLFYGPAYSLKVFSKAGEYTQTVIRIRD